MTKFLHFNINNVHKSILVSTVYFCSMLTFIKKSRRNHLLHVCCRASYIFSMSCFSSNASGRSLLFPSTNTWNTKTFITDAMKMFKQWCAVKTRTSGLQGFLVTVACLKDCAARFWKLQLSPGLLRPPCTFERKRNERMRILLLYN